MYYGAYADIFNENQFIRKPIQNDDSVVLNIIINQEKMIFFTHISIAYN